MTEGLPASAYIISYPELTAANWEKGRSPPHTNHMPSIVRFLRYNPLTKELERLTESFEILEEFTPVLLTLALPQLEELATLSEGVS